MSSFCTHIFSANKFQHICVSLDVNFNESLTNDIVRFEQLGPEFEQTSVLVKPIEQETDVTVIVPDKRSIQIFSYLPTKLNDCVYSLEEEKRQIVINEFSYQPIYSILSLYFTHRINLFGKKLSTSIYRLQTFMNFKYKSKSSLNTWY